MQTAKYIVGIFVVFVSVYEYIRVRNIVRTAGSAMCNIIMILPLRVSFY